MKKGINSAGNSPERNPSSGSRDSPDASRLSEENE
jgi:hypothetical protein